MEKYKLEEVDSALDCPYAGYDGQEASSSWRGCSLETTSRAGEDCVPWVAGVGRAFQIRQPVLAMFLIFRSRPDHMTVLMVMDAQTAVGSETWDPV